MKAVNGRTKILGHCYLMENNLHIQEMNVYFYFFINFCMKNVRLVATDLDGTFLRNDRTVSTKNLEALSLLGEKSIIRVAATGRNLKKVREVIQPETTFDYIVYSSGAGVFDWNEQREMFHQNLTQKSSEKLLHFFLKENISFHAFFPAPNNHNHWYFRDTTHIWFAKDRRPLCINRWKINWSKTKAY